MPQLLTGDEARAALGDHAAVLVFVKLWRRTQMVRALIDLPMLISTAHVPAELELKHAKKFTTLSMNETAERYRNYRFTLNSHPGLTHLLHDRLTVAAALNSALITDANAAVQHYFQDGVHALFFDLARPDASVQQVAAHLDDPARAFALTVQAAAVRDATDHFDYREGYAKLLDFVAAHWAARGGPAPVAVPA